MNKNLNLGITSFYASLHKIDECEINGLPRLPYSVNIIGKFEELKGLNHPNLCTYIDAKRDKHERIVIATEYFPSNFQTKFPDISNIGKEKCIEIFYRLTSAIEYLHGNGIIVRNISARNIFWTEDDNVVKLANHGLYYMTKSGSEIDFLIGNVPYLPPESVLDLFNKDKPVLSCPRSDVWSIGVLLIQTLCGGNLPKLFADLKNSAKYILDCYISNQDFLTAFELKDLDPDLLEIAKQCLKLDITDRISMSELKSRFVTLRRSQNLIYQIDNEFSTSNLQNFNIDFCMEKLSDPTKFHDAKERYYFWTLTGGDLWKYQAQIWDNQKKIPSILTLPILIRENGSEFWSSSIAQSVKQLFCDSIYPLPSDKLFDRLAKLPRTLFYEPKLCLPDEFKPFEFSKIDFVDTYDQDEIQVRSQPVWVKEKDFEYQLRRVVRFKRILNGYPLTKSALLREASYDIPPLLRSEIWPLLLEIDVVSATKQYNRVQGVLLEDKAASQITVDLPRCHSYDELIVSSSGQEKLSRILHAWLLHHRYLEYTQGMDSLCAVFVRLLFNKEPTAFACLEAFVNKFMRGLFCVSHGQALNEYCHVLQQLLAFHKPHLSQAVSIFSITGFTASWIYTGFAHSLSLDKTLRLWDTVILGEPSFLMMIFIALLGQLDQESAFSSQAAEHVFSVLSNLQEFDLDQCRSEAIDLARRTPPSITSRSMANDSSVVAKFVDPSSICVSPRISFEDLLVLLGESGVDDVDNVGTLSPFAFQPDLMPAPVLLDLRKRDSFQRGSLAGSKHLPVVSASPHTTFCELEALGAQSMIEEAGKGGLVVLIGTGDDPVCEMAARVLVNSYHLQYVCILQGGINAVHAHRPDLLEVLTH